MNFIRGIIGLLSFFLLFGLVGCSKTPASAIESVLNHCARTSEKVNKSNMSGAQVATYVADEAQQIDTRDCPEDFRVAFQEHINAWRDAAPYFAQDTGVNAFLEGVYAGSTGNNSTIGLSHENAAIASQNINDTYYRLVDIAVSHGARVPNSGIRK